MDDREELAEVGERVQDAVPGELEFQGVTPAISIFLPSHNKSKYVQDALRSVFAQSRTDWELWILENSTDGGATREKIEYALYNWCRDSRQIVHYEKIESIPRERVYPTAWLLNRYYPEANGKYIFYLSDDDVLEPHCLEKMAGYLDEHPDVNVVYAGLYHEWLPGPGKTPAIPATGIRTTAGSVDNQIDGGQVMHTKAALGAIAFPYFPESNEPLISRHCDGIFMEKLVDKFPFYPVREFLITHRFTPVSVWTKS